jgi:hypothetical protein
VIRGRNDGIDGTEVEAQICEQLADVGCSRDAPAERRRAVLLRAKIESTAPRRVRGRRRVRLGRRRTRSTAAAGPDGPERPPDDPDDVDGPAAAGWAA